MTNTAKATITPTVLVLDWTEALELDRRDQEADDQERQLLIRAHDRAMAALRSARAAEAEVFAQLEAYTGNLAGRALLNQKLARARYATTVALETLKGL